MKLDIMIILNTPGKRNSKYYEDKLNEDLVNICKHQNQK